ncbi:multiprotein-bridging factor 1 family protein [Xanthobacteraceae bacterium A53D]
MPNDVDPSRGSQVSDSIFGHYVRIINPDMVNGRLIAAARTLLGWDQQELAERAGMKRQTLADMEGDVRRSQARIRQAVLAALAAGGVIFVECGGATGVVLRNGGDAEGAT